MNQINIWRGGKSRAKYPLCWVQVWYSSYQQDEPSFQIFNGNPAARGSHISSYSRSAFIDFLRCHAVAGNRIQLVEVA